MSNRLAQKYARYGLLANLNLSAIEHLREGDIDLRPSGDDQKRLLLLQDLLKASWEGAFINGKIDRAEPPGEGETHLNLAPRAKSARSARSSLDDARIVEGALPDNYELPGFVREAVPVLSQVIRSGLKEADCEFVAGPLTQFLERLARSSRTQSSSERRRRQHVPLA